MELSELTLRDIQPSQFYISEEKLRAVQRWFRPEDLSRFEPIPIKMLDGRPVMTDGHTRAAAAVLAGLDAVPLVWETDELGWEMYRRCVAECVRRGVLSPLDLPARILPGDEYREKWDRWCERMQTEIENDPIRIVRYTGKEIPDVLAFERQLREEEPDWGWEINEQYIRSVTDSFRDARFEQALSFLAYRDGRVVGRIDAILLPTHFDGTIKAYLDWICVLKSCRHAGVARALLARLRAELKERGVDTLVALTASNDEAQRFYKAIPNSKMGDIGIWIDI